MHRQLRPLALLPLVALAACSSAASGGPEGAAASTTAPASVPFAGSTSTTAMPSATTPSTTAASGAASTPTSGFEMTAEMLTHLLATEQGRQLIVTGMTSRSGITTDQATCFINHVKVETLVALSRMGGTDATAAAAAPPEVLADLQQALTTCNIPLDALMPR